ncbi:cysteine desulfurase family protein [Aurantibacillus circumpalustris]|uniref:cysteine desulfurase family protein n=1 Tax=Aurantibacillus circumpalustris TaxID=3036359 RepID=UPI00295B1DD7|nr:aminotransferase class V-fold PLP-dependent enzyme [Aurantibacillus circumpalustris]
MNRISNLIYFNNNRTTQIDKSVAEAMRLIEKSEQSKEEVTSKAKQQIGDLLNAASSEILFTSGTTESINLFIKGGFNFLKTKGKHVITNVTEHFATLDCLKELELEDAEVTRLGVDREGLIDLQEFRKAIKKDTIMVCLMAANNETGVIQPVEEIAEICEENGVLFFSDASQFAGKVRCDTKEIGFSGIAFGAHKMYGPAGIGVLYIHQKYAELMDIIKHAYTQELSLAQIAGFGLAAEISSKNYWEDSAHISRLKNYFEHQLLDLQGLTINGSTRTRLYNTSNITFADSEKVILLKERFDFADNVKKPSYVLQSMGLNAEEIKNSFRFSFGKNNTLDEVKSFVEEMLR